MQLLGRNPMTVLGALFQKRHYEALVRMTLNCDRPAEFLWRYLTKGGSYPRDFTLTTPLGSKTVRSHTHHDLLTINEVFCREDYQAPTPLGCVVDIGSNIGISALYFLTRNDKVDAYLFEPVPQNVARLKETLRGMESRYRLETVCVGTADGMVDFGIEPTGRYGGIGVATGQTVQYPCREINGILAEVLKQNAIIDLLKLDIEGTDWQVLERIAPSHLERVSLIYSEMNGTGLQLPGFVQSQRGPISRWERTG